MADRLNWLDRLWISCIAIAAVAGAFSHKRLMFWGLCLVVGSLCYTMTRSGTRAEK